MQGIANSRGAHDVGLCVWVCAQAHGCCCNLCCHPSLLCNTTEKAELSWKGEELEEPHKYACLPHACRQATWQSPAGRSLLCRSLSLPRPCPAARNCHVSICCSQAATAAADGAHPSQGVVAELRIPCACCLQAVQGHILVTAVAWAVSMGL